jgi:hypothetical protein
MDYHIAHHGSYNGTSPPLVKAVSPTMAVISMGPPDRDAMWTAVAYGHPRKVAGDMIAAALKENGRSPSLYIKVATKAGSKGAASQREFVKESMTKAIYATGWDGTVVVSADNDHQLHVDVKGHP